MSKRSRKPPLSQDEAARQELKRAKHDAISELMTSIAEIIQGIFGLLGHG
jgi:hypothetical protein